MFMLRLFFSKNYEKKMFDAIVNKSSSIIADKIEKNSTINMERINYYFQKYINEIQQYNNNGIPELPSQLNQMNTEESKLVIKHIIEERKANIAAKACVRAAKISGLFSLFATTIAASTAYWYFRQIQNDPEKNRKEIEELRKKILRDNANLIYQRDLLEKAEHLVYYNCIKKDIRNYEQHKAIKEKELLNSINKIPTNQVCNSLKASNS